MSFGSCGCYLSVRTVEPTAIGTDRMKKAAESAYDKWNIFVVICDTYMPQNSIKS